MLISTDLTAQTRLQPELLANESLLWAGRPQTGIRLRSSDAFLIPFSIIWCGFAVFWEYLAVHGGAPFFFGLWGIPFICAGLYITVGRFVYDMLNRRNTLYGVTGQRIIIKSGVLKPVVNSYHIAILTTLRLEEKADGSGSIILSPPNRFDTPFRINFGGLPGQNGQPDIEFIEHVRQVYNLILKQQGSGTSGFGSRG